MIIELLLTVFYLTLLLYAVPRWAYFAKSGLGTTWLRTLLVLKAGLSIVYGYYWLLNGGGDTWGYMRYSRMIYDTLYINPLYYLELTFGPNARRPPDYLCEIIEPIMHWSDIRTYTVLRVNALLHLISGGYYSVHAVFFAFFSLIGLIGIYRTLLAVASTTFLDVLGSRLLRYVWLREQAQRVYVMPFIAVFALPSVWFWGSGVHKEALSILGIGLVVFCAYALITRRASSPGRSWVVLLVALAFLLLLRSYIVMLLAPALLAWWVSSRYLPHRAGLVYAITYGLSLLVVRIAPLLHPKLDLLSKIVAIQYYYLIFSGSTSDLKVARLSPTLESFAANTPAALYRVLVLPIYYSGSHWWQLLLTAIENIAFLGFMVATVVCRRATALPHDRAFLGFCLAFALSYTLLIGLINDNVGAIVRYRSTILIFWVAVCGLCWDHKKAL